MFAAPLMLAVVAMQASPDTLLYQVINHGRHAGTMEVVTVADTIVVRIHSWDRNYETNTNVKYVTNEAGMIVRREQRVGDDRDPVEHHTMHDGVVRWQSPVDSGTVEVARPAFYWPRGENRFDEARLAAFLLGQPQQTADLLPSHATASAHVAVDTIVAVNGRSERVRLVVIDAPDLAPYLVWLDSQDRLFAGDAAWLTTVRAGAESTLPLLRSMEREVLARRSEAVARRLTEDRTGPLVIRNGNLFDSEATAIRKGMTVVVEGERITAVGPDGTVPVPPGATIVDATGKMVLPGLWDMHAHMDGWRWGRTEVGGILALANGITTIRDLGSDVDRAVSFRDRADAGTLISPRILLAGFMEGPGRTAGPTDAIVGTEDEAIEWVARYDSLGYLQIKIYNLVPPDIVAAIAEEAKGRGMRLSGHLRARGLSVEDMVRLGFDEIQHVSLLRRFILPDSLRARLEAGELLDPAARSAAQLALVNGIDMDGPEATRLIELLRDHGTVIDGTFNLTLDRDSASIAGPDPLLGPTLEWLPPIARREYTVAATPQAPASRLRRLGEPKYQRFLERLYGAGVTIVPGTDNTTFAYAAELEIYERAGIPAPEVLRIATLVPAQVMGEERDYGSIEAGKVADIIIVDGNPAARITDLRRIETVVRAGRVYSVRDLYAEVGVTPRW
jgi:imidazolonepropionase-like amidohydrolase